MYKILIIDDETIIRKSISKLIETNLPECEPPEEARSAAEGIEKVNLLTPDIIITDICMNDMTGLDMLKKLNTCAKVIVITGYRSFEYAQSAIDLNVFSLLLKPIKQQELIRILKSAIESINNERQNALKAENLNQILVNNLPYIRQKLLSDLIYGLSSSYAEDVKNSLDMYGITIRSFYMLLFEISDASGALNGIDMHLIQCDIISQFQELLRQTNELYHLFLDCEKLAVIMKNDLSVYKTDNLLSICAKLISAFRLKHPDINIAIGISTQGSDTHDLNVKYRECKRAVSFIRNSGYNSVISFESLGAKNEAEQKNHRELLRYKNLLIDALDSEDSMLVKKYSGKISELVLKFDSGDLKLLHRFYTQILFHINDLRQELIHDSDSDLPNSISNIERLVDDCDNIRDLDELLQISLSNILVNMNSLSSKNLSSHINLAIEYIEQNFRNNISLTDVAEHIHLSTIHTSRLFKAKTGKKITDYINELRIDAAKKLIDTQEYKICDIASMVGVPDNHYFSKLFKKYTGKTPSEYRS